MTTENDNNTKEALAQLEAALTNVNEAYGCVICRKTHRALLLLEQARKTLDRAISANAKISGENPR